MPNVNVNNVSLYYEEKGEGEPLVLCHGIPTDYRAWTFQVDTFARFYRTITYSRRYASPNIREGDASDSTIGNNANDLQALSEKLGLDSMNLIGHSYGGFIAAFLAANHPSLVKSLVLVEPAISTLLIENQNSTGQMFSLLIKSPSAALSARKFIGTSLKPSLAALDSGNLEKAVELNIDGLQERKGAFASMPDASRTMMLQNAKTIGELRTQLPPFKESLGKIKCRLMVINGENSPVWLHRIGEIICESVPQCQLFKVPGSAHFPHLENPSRFNDSVLGFLSKEK